MLLTAVQGTQRVQCQDIRNLIRELSILIRELFAILSRAFFL